MNGATERAAERAREIVDEISGRLAFESRADISFTGCLLNQLYTTEAIRDGLPHAHEEEGYSLPVQHLDKSPATLPEPTVAEHLIKVFFELSNFSVPILHEPTFRNHISTLSGDDPTSNDHKAAFFAFIVYAIALLTLQKHDSVKVSTSLCERYFASALQSLDAAGLPSDIEGVQALLLISLYSYLHPNAFQPWRTLGMAMRHAISLGLHMDLPSEKTDPLTLDTRRRVFWVAYAMDRTVSNVLRRPFAISDGSINCQVHARSYLRRLFAFHVQRSNDFVVSKSCRRRVHHERRYSRRAYRQEGLWTSLLPISAASVRDTSHPERKTAIRMPFIRLHFLAA